MIGALKTCTAAGAAIALFVSSAAHADWSARKGEDRLTGKPWARLDPEFDSGLSMFITCWSGTGRTPADKLLLSIAVGRYDDYAVTFEPQVQAIFRADENEPVEVSLVPAPLDGLFTYGTGSHNVAILALLKRIGAAKQRVVLSLIGSTHETSARGSAAAAELLIKTCNLP
jgi:hypothetical protein